MKAKERIQSCILIHFDWTSLINKELFYFMAYRTINPALFRVWFILPTCGADFDIKINNLHKTEWDMGHSISSLKEGVNNCVSNAMSMVTLRVGFHLGKLYMNDEIRTVRLDLACLNFNDVFLRSGLIGSHLHGCTIAESSRSLAPVLSQSIY